MKNSEMLGLSCKKVYFNCGGPMRMGFGIVNGNNSSSGGNFVRGSIYLNDSFTEKCWLQYISSGIE